MATMEIGDLDLDIDPTSVSWSLTINTFSEDTYGGRVIQLLSRRTTGASVTGYVYVDTYRKGLTYQFGALDEFEKKIVDFMDRRSNGSGPSHIRMPALEWDGYGFIRSVSGLEYNVELAAVQYTLDLEITDGMDAGISSSDVTDIDWSSIPDGVNYVRSIYNTPAETTFEQVLEGLRKVLNNMGSYDATDVPSIYEAMDAVSQADRLVHTDEGESKETSNEQSAGSVPLLRQAGDLPAASGGGAGYMNAN